MISYNMPWWTIQSWDGWRNWQQTEMCHEDQAADCSRSLDPRRRNREAHSGPSESVERRCHSERQNADECDRMSPTLGCTCRPDTTAMYGAGTCWPMSTTWIECVGGLVASAGRHAGCQWCGRTCTCQWWATLITAWSGRRLVVVMPYSTLLH